MISKDLRSRRKTCAIVKLKNNNGDEDVIFDQRYYYLKCSGKVLMIDDEKVKGRIGRG